MPANKKLPLLKVAQINDGEIFTYNGPVEVENSIGKGAIVTTLDGLKVHGDVLPQAHITVKHSQNNLFKSLFLLTKAIFTGKFGVYLFNNHIFFSNAHTLEVFGHTHDHVTYINNSGSTLLQNSDDYLTVDTKLNFKGLNLGKEADIAIGFKADIGMIGDGSKVKATEATVGDMLKNSKLDVTFGTRIGTVGPGSKVKASEATVGNMLENTKLDVTFGARIGTVGSGSKVKASEATVENMLENSKLVVTFDAYIGTVGPGSEVKASSANIKDMQENSKLDVTFGADVKRAHRSAHIIDNTSSNVGYWYY